MRKKARSIRLPSLDGCYQTENVEALDKKIASSALNLVQSGELEPDCSESQETPQPKELVVQANVTLESAEISKRAKGEHLHKGVSGLMQAKLPDCFM